MKLKFNIFFGGLLSLLSLAVVADSVVLKSKINIQTRNNNAVAVAKEKNSMASVGSVNVKRSKVVKTEVNIIGDFSGSEAVAEDKDSETFVGSVIFR